MALPRIASAVHTFKTLDGKPIHYRAYKMGDEQALLEAKESQNEEIIINTIFDVLNGLIINKVDVKKLPTYEVEHFLLQTRIVSVGNVVESRMKCTECNKPMDLEIDLSKVYIKDERPATNEIVVGQEETTGEEVKVLMKYPTFADAGLMKSENQKNAMRACIESIQVGDTYHDFAGVTDDEIDEWLLSLTKDKIGLIFEFINKIPKLQLEVQTTCKCGASHDFTIRNFEDFFA